VKAALVLMAYGSPERLADVPAYYSDIRGGRAIPPELMADLVERYRRLGIADGSPPNAITEETRAALARELGDVPVFTGMKHWTPRIAEAVDAAVASGAETVVGLVLAPHYSSMSIAGYREQLERGLGGRAEPAFIESWHDEPGFIDLLGACARNGRARRLHSPFFACPHPPVWGPVQGPTPGDRPASRRAGSARDMVVLVSERVPDRRTVARPRHP